MKRANVLWLALVAVVLYIAMNYTFPAQAQPQRAWVRVDVVHPTESSMNNVHVSGRIVGFSCTASDDRPAQCFIASTD